MGSTALHGLRHEVAWVELRPKNNTSTSKELATLLCLTITGAQNKDQSSQS